MTFVYRSAVIVAMTAAIGCAADWSIFRGVWKLNTAKSRFESPAKQAQMVTVANGITTVEETLSDGTRRRWSHKFGDGQDVPISGLENASVTSRQTGERTMTQTWKIGDRTASGRGILASDDKTMTYTVTGRTPDGKPFKDVLIFEKQ